MMWKLMKLLTGGTWAIWLFTLIIMVFPFTGFSQSITATARLDTNVMMIGDQVNLDLKLSLPAGYQFSWPSLSDTLVKNLDILSRSKIDTTFSKDRKNFTITQRLRLTSFDSGQYMIPGFRFLYRHLPDTAVKTAESPEIALMVHTVKVDTTRAIKPIKGPMKIPMSFRELLPWILAATGVLLILMAIAYYLWRKKKQQPVFHLKTRVKLKPGEVALMELEKLRVKKLWQNNRFKEYHTELTEILRKYIEERLTIMALEKTSAEILFDLRQSGNLSPKTLNNLEEVLTTADMVKFAKAEPLPDEHEQSMQYAIAFVKDTTVVESTDKTSSQGPEL